MMEFEKTVILSLCHVTQLFETEKSRALDYVNISEMNFIAGAYNVDNIYVIKIYGGWSSFIL